jgi:hypothetical protein
VRLVGIALLSCLAGCQLIFEHQPRDAAPVAGDAEPDAFELRDARTPPVPAVLVAHYEMNLVNGINQVTDVVGGHHATCISSQCPTVVSGVDSNALSFDGTKLLRVPSAMDFETMGAGFTIAFWLDADTTRTELHCAVAKPLMGSQKDSWAVCLASVFPFVASTHEPDTFDMIGSPNKIPDGFHHVAMRWDGVRREIYIDGRLENFSPATGAVVFDASDLVIGGDLEAGSPMLHFHGVIDDLRIYFGALSPQEILTLVVPPA